MMEIWVSTLKQTRQGKCSKANCTELLNCMRNWQGQFEINKEFVAHFNKKM